MMTIVSLARSLFVIVALLTLTVPGEAGEQKAPAPSPAPASPPTAAIPVAEVATRAANVLNLLPTLTAQLAPSAAIQEILRQLPEVSERIDVDLEGTAQFLQGQPSLGTIAAQQEGWKERQRRTTGWLNLLTQRATSCATRLWRSSKVPRSTWNEFCVL